MRSLSFLRPANPQFSLRSGVQTASAHMVTSGRYCPVPGTHHYPPGTANLPGRKLLSRTKLGSATAGTHTGTQVWAMGLHRPRLQPEMVDGLRDLSRTRPRLCAPCDPKHLVSRAVGWRAGLQAPAASPSAGAHPSFPPIGMQLGLQPPHCAAEQLHVWLERPAQGLCPLGQVRRAQLRSRCTAADGAWRRGGATLGGGPCRSASEEGSPPVPGLAWGPWEGQELGFQTSGNTLCSFYS